MKYGETCEGLPNDIINFLHDPLACSIALGWDEGVETEEEALLLGLAGCDELQGFFFAKPASALDFATFLRPSASSDFDLRLADSA